MGSLQSSEAAQLSKVVDTTLDLARAVQDLRAEAEAQCLLGDVLQAQGRLEAAQKAYGESLAISRRLVEQDPSNADWQRELCSFQRSFRKREAPTATHLQACQSALNRFMTMLGCRKSSWQSCEGKVPIGTLVADFDQYLTKLCGLSAATRFYRRRYAREFLKWRFEGKRWDLTKLCFTDFVDYVKFRAPRLKPGSVGVMMISLRSLVRFLEFEGRCRSGLSQAWPAVPNWKQSPPSDVLNAKECRELLQCVDRHCPSGQRDFAILRLMTDLGLRGAEIVELCLEDIDWRASTLVVRKNKQRRERLLPLPSLVAKAILSYLRTGRPSSSSRRLFLCHRLPVGQPMTTERLRGAVRRIMRRAGLTGGGPHRLRHSFATRLHAQGASLKEVADVLGHQDFDTTAIYARVNLSQLRKVALPWPRTRL
jgi:site-specific recombinase XerD